MVTLRQWGDGMWWYRRLARSGISVIYVSASTTRYDAPSETLLVSRWQSWQQRIAAIRRLYRRPRLAGVLAGTAHALITWHH